MRGYFYSVATYSKKVIATALPTFVYFSKAHLNISECMISSMLQAIQTAAAVSAAPTG